jgi:hypothetical protein
VGAADASFQGIRGFWLPTVHGTLPYPISFHFPFPDHLKCCLISSSNMSGDLTNSDFELTALIVNTIALMSQHISTPHAAIWCGSNNTSAASWCKKGSTSSIGSTAHLLQWLAQLTWDYHVLLTPFHISSSTNAMANFCSRSFLLIRNSFRNLTKNSLYTLLGHLPHLHQM